jgi:mannose/fructose/N-acetylgalactosamine-specific phosphotransferase system component IID
MKVQTQVWLRSFLLQLSFDPKHMQELGYGFAILPHLKKQYQDNGLIDQTRKQLSFFNTHPWLISPILGAHLHESLKNNNEEHSIALKTATMGPFGGIGDQMAWFLVLPFLSLISLIFSQDHLLSVLLLGVSLILIRLILSFALYQKAYQKGMLYLLTLAQNFQKLYQIMRPLGMVSLAAIVLLVFEKERLFQHYDVYLYALLMYGLLKKTQLSQMKLVLLIVLSQVFLWILK